MVHHTTSQLTIHYISLFYLCILAISQLNSLRMGKGWVPLYSASHEDSNSDALIIGQVSDIGLISPKIKQSVSVKIKQIF